MDPAQVQPIAGSDDLFAFVAPLTLEGKAAATVEELDDGDLIIEGWAAQFSGVDRQNEQFMEGAFSRGIKAFMAGAHPICFHHKAEKVLGSVLELEEVEGKGLKFRGRIDGAIKTHPELGTYYRQVKNGSLSGLSVGGFFKRKLTPEGYRIADMDFTEVSVTGVPIDNSKPSFAVVAGKALMSEAVDEPVQTPEVPDALASAVASLDATLTGYEGKAISPKGGKGEDGDLYFLALLLKLEQYSNTIATENERTENETGEAADEDSAGDERVDALGKRVKTYLDGISREAHALAAELGPLPSLPSYL